MKSMKKILALALALVFVLGLATTASAVTTQTISVKSTDTHSYAVYQIFTGDLEDGKLVNVALGTHGKLPAGTTLEAALEALAAVRGSADTAELAEILKYVDMTKGAIGNVDKDNPMSVDSGYYLLKDLGPTGENESLSLYIVEVVDDVEINPKRGTIIPSKKVDDVNDSDADEDYNLKNEDSADYDIGDDVPFTLTATLPDNYADFSVYKLVFHDEMEDGLTFLPETVEVYLGTTLLENTKYQLITNPDDTCDFEIDFADLKQSLPTAKAGDVLTVKFKAELNDQAAKGATGNANEMFLEFSNDPNWVPDPNAETPPPPPTDETPKDKVVVFTYEILVNKVDEDGEPLAGATFELFKWDLEANEGAGDWVSLGVLEGGAGTEFVWTGIDDGKYKLEEVDAPAGYNKLAPIEFVVTATHTEEGADPELITLAADNTFVADKTTGVLSADIQNLPGAVLPETGGIGTTLFYIIGGLLVVAAVVLLVTKKRMASAE